MCRIALAGLLPMLLPLFAALVCAAAPGALRPPHPRRRARTSRGGRAKRDRANGTHGSWDVHGTAARVAFRARLRRAFSCRM